MDAFTEKELMDSIKSIASSLKGIEGELVDLNVAVREAIEAQYEYEDDEEDVDDESEEEEEGEESNSIIIEDVDDEESDDEDGEDKKDREERDGQEIFYED